VPQNSKNFDLAGDVWAYFDVDYVHSEVGYVRWRSGSADGSRLVGLRKEYDYSWIFMNICEYEYMKNSFLFLYLDTINYHSFHSCLTNYGGIAKLGQAFTRRVTATVQYTTFVDANRWKVSRITIFVFSTSSSWLQWYFGDSVQKLPFYRQLFLRLQIVSAFQRYVLGH
jgi:hypothetical protein